MNKFIKITYGQNWHAWIQGNHVTMVETREDGKALIHLTGNESAYWVDQTVEEIMEMING